MTEEQIKESVEELYLFLEDIFKPGLEELIEKEQGLEFDTAKELVEYAETSEDYKDSVFVHIFNLNQHFNND
jgi:hypothetical protein